MKKILIHLGDINPKKNSSWGIFNTSKNILQELVASKKFEIIITTTNKNEKLFSDIKCKKIIFSEYDNNFFNKVFLNNSLINKTIKDIKPDIAFFPRGFIPLKKIKGVIYIPLIYDLIILYYLKRLKFWAFFGTISSIFSMKKSDKIITISEFSKKEIRKFSKKEITVIPLGYDPASAVPPKSKKDSYVFIIGNKHPHKNLDKSIKIIKKYNKLRNKNYKIHFSTGNLTPQEIAGYYKNAEFSLFLSSIEGFGLPLIESYYHETPVVFNNKTSLREIGKNLPGKCNIENEESIFKAIDEILKIKKSKIKNIKNYLMKKYNWKRCGEKLINEFSKTNI